MSVELVAAPARYPRGPLLALVIVAIIPAVGLYLLHRWSDDVADEHDAVEERTIEYESAYTEAELERPPAPQLETGLLDVRRAPAAIAEAANTEQLSTDMQNLYAFVGPDSCVALSVDGRPVDGANTSTAAIPGSTEKLLVATVALDVLGPDHRYTTSVIGPPVVDGRIDGDVYLVGGGDPLLISEDFPNDEDEYPPFATTSLDELADRFVASGVEFIDGALVGDGSRYDDEWFVEGWADDVPAVEAGPYDALMVNDSRRLYSSQVQDDPNLAAAVEFVRLLNERGVIVNYGWDAGSLAEDDAERSADDPPPDRQTLASIDSAPLGEIVGEMNVNSDDNTAELLLKEIGFAVDGEGTRTGGLNVVDRTLRSWGVPMEGVRILDGSGLHASNRLTCDALLAVLQRGRTLGLPSMLAVAGISGTLADEFVDTEMEGRMRAKTGTLGHPPVEEPPPAAKALAGYVEVPTGEMIEFVMLLNTPDISFDDNYEPMWLALANRLATYPGGPTAEEISP
jgi:D-alanyl-D-alanine carboxypeptidase/D-alanyl-D-alanine-endopeptidase (penicillin-binding protein 4)